MPLYLRPKLRSRTEETPPASLYNGLRSWTGGRNGRAWWRPKTSLYNGLRSGAVHQPLPTMPHNCGFFAYNDSFSPLRRSRSESFGLEEDNPIASKSRRVTVEEVTDKEDGRRYFEPYPEAGWTLREGQTFANEYESRFLY